MSTTKPIERNPERANAQLDALLSRGILADKRANKSAPPPVPVSRPSPIPADAAITPTPVSNSRGQVYHLERLTVRFTQDEARLLEKARGVARSMGFKVSDTAVFRLALNAFNPDRMTTQSIEAVLAADGRRRDTGSLNGSDNNQARSIR